VRFSLTLSLTHLAPETGARLSPTAALPILLLPRGKEAEPLPRPSPTACERPKQRSPHPSSQARSQEAVIRLPQLAPTVRSDWFPSARYALPLVGMMPAPIASHEVQLTR
jgi:hypothetical protein